MNVPPASSLWIREMSMTPFGAQQVMPVQSWRIALSPDMVDVTVPGSLSCLSRNARARSDAGQDKPGMDECARRLARLD